MQKSRRGIGIATALLTMLILILIGLIIKDTAEFRVEVRKGTENHVMDVSKVLAEDLDNRFDSVIEVMESIDDSLNQVDSVDADALAEYLTRKMLLHDFLSFHVVSPDGVAVSVGEIKQDVAELPCIEQAWNGRHGTSILSNDDMAYAIPIVRDNEVQAALCGVRSLENIRSMLQTDTVGGHAKLSLNSTDGTIKIASEAGAYDEVRRYFSQERSSEHRDKIEADLENHTPGIISFHNDDGVLLHLAYHQLGEHDHWLLYTLLSDEDVSAELNAQVQRTCFLSVGIIVSLLVLLTAIFVQDRLHMKRLQEAFYTDHTTGGLSISAFQYKCEEQILQAKPNTYTMLSLNISRFKLVNAQLGASEADRILRYMMNVISHEVREIGFAARGHADVFYACLRSADFQKIMGIAAQIRKNVQMEQDRINLDAKQKTELAVQIGAYIVDDAKLDITAMQDRATMACRSYTSESDGPCVLFNEEMRQMLSNEQELLGNFEDALKEGQFHIYWQPKVKTGNGKLGGAEALARWNHPVRGLIPPGIFIPILERNEKISLLDFYVFEKVCQSLRRWLDEGKPVVTVSVNTSGLSLLHRDSLDKYVALVKEYQIPEGLLELELTETIFMDDRDMERIRSLIQGLHDVGIRCSMDDFGSGFSSFYMLMELDIDTLKLDRSMFFAWEKEKTKNLISSLLATCKGLKIQTIAEGIETQEMAAELKKLGCDLIQGFIYAKPMPTADFEDWFDKADD